MVLASLNATFTAADDCIYKFWCSDCSATVYEFVVVPQIVYVLCWALPYFLVMFCCCAGYIERSGQDTLYKYTLVSISELWLHPALCHELCSVLANQECSVSEEVVRNDRRGRMGS